MWQSPGWMRLVQLRTRAPGRRPDASEWAEALAEGLGEVAPLNDRQRRTVRYLRVSLTDRCNYRCTYCMPEEGVDHVGRTDILDLEEVLLLVRAFVHWGVERVRLTGGEPTVRKNFLWLVRELTQIRRPDGELLEVTMTTNGEQLQGQARDLAEAGLRGLTVSIDSLRADRFTQITRRGHLDRVIAGIEAARAAGLEPIKLNTVAIRGFNDDELGELCRFAWDRDLTPRFIELMPMAEGRLFVPGELMPAAELRASIAADLGAELEPVRDMRVGQGIRGYGPATYWRVSDGRYAGRRLGTIAAITENFCDSCNRLRVAANGQLQACLARDDAGELRAALRRGDVAAVEAVVRDVLGAKRERHGFDDQGGGGPAKAMISIGG